LYYNVALKLQKENAVCGGSYCASAAGGVQQQKIRRTKSVALLRKDSFTERKPEGERGRTSFYGMNRHTGIKTTPPGVPFSAPINDIYGEHVIFGDKAGKIVDEEKC